jgi:DNA replication and repair protein RecF
LEFGERFNLFSGDNGQGKTNYLEAIFFLGTLKSFRHARPLEMINWQQTVASIHGNIVEHRIAHSLQVSFQSHGKTLSVDGKQAPRLIDYCQMLPVVAFSPDELAMVNGAPEQRRRYLDRAIFSSNPEYLKLYHDYYRVLKQRNQLLRIQNYNGLDAWTEQLVTTGTRLMVARNVYLSFLSRLFSPFYDTISGSDGHAHLCYHPYSFDIYPDEQVVAENFRKVLAECSKLERQRGMTLAGPHRDDIGFFLHDRPIRHHGSQGEQKSFVLALKMAEIAYHKEHRSTSPILLLDDMTAELDQGRIGHLLDFLIEQQLQVFISTTDPNLVPLPVSIDRRTFSVVDGQT